MITIIDYGVGNIKAFVNIYNQLDIPVKIASSHQDIEKASKLILPGVGSFDYAINNLKKLDYYNPLQEIVLQKHTPILGICVGMQILGNISQEGEKTGLNWINGNNIKFNQATLQPVLPHMGWNTIEVKKKHPILNGIASNDEFYFLHSYHFECLNTQNIVATTNYGISFTSIISDKNIIGIQFHPEKSHSAGVKILCNFAKI